MKFRAPTNGASQGNFFLPKSPKISFFDKKNTAFKNSSGSQNAYFLNFSSIPCQTAELLGQNVAVLALSPGHTGHFLDKKNFETYIFAIDVLKNFSPFCFSSPEIIGVKFGNRQTDKFFDTIYGCMWIFSLS